MIRARRHAVVAVLLVAAFASGCTGDDPKAKRPTTTAVRSTTSVPSTTTLGTSGFNGQLVAVTADDAPNDKVQMNLARVNDQYQVIGRVALGAPYVAADVPARARIALDTTAAWVVTSGGGKSRVTRVAGDRAAAPLELNVPDASVATGAGFAWVAADGSVLQLSAADGTTLNTISGDKFPPGFTAAFVAVTAGEVWVAATNGGLATIDPASLTVTAQEPLVASCSTATTVTPPAVPGAPQPAPVPAAPTTTASGGDRTVVRDFVAAGTRLHAIVGRSCDAQLQLLSIDTAVNFRVTNALPGALNQEIRALVAGPQLLLARVQPNDLLPVGPDGTPGSPIPLPARTLAESCGAGRRGVACTSGLDEVAFVTLPSSAPKAEPQRITGLDGGALAWAVG